MVLYLTVFKRDCEYLINMLIRLSVTIYFKTATFSELIKNLLTEPDSRAEFNQQPWRFILKVHAGV